MAAILNPAVAEVVVGIEPEAHAKFKISDNQIFVPLPRNQKAVRIFKGGGISGFTDDHAIFHRPVRRAAIPAREVFAIEHRLKALLIGRRLQFLSAGHANHYDRAQRKHQTFDFHRDSGRGITSEDQDL